MRRGISLPPDEFGRLRVEVRIVGRDITIEPLQLQPVLGPDPRYHHVYDFELSAQFARVPQSSGESTIRSPKTRGKSIFNKSINPARFCVYRLYYRLVSGALAHNCRMKSCINLQASQILFDVRGVYQI